MKVQGNAGDTVFLLIACDSEERQWIEDNIQPGDYNPDYPQTVIVEHRYIGVIVNGITAAGFYVEMGGA